MLLKRIVAIALASLFAGIASFLVRLWILSRWPAQVPPELAFEHQLTSDKTLRTIAELLAARFGGPAAGNIVCLGPVRGSAGRVLFHSGPNNRGHNRNLYRPDYVLHVVRLGERRVELRLETNKPYSYLRIRRSEVEPLVRALRESFGGLREL